MDDAQARGARGAGGAGEQQRTPQASAPAAAAGDDAAAAAAGSCGQLQSEQQQQHQQQLLLQQQVSPIPGATSLGAAMDDPAAVAAASASASSGQQQSEQPPMEPIPGARNYGYSDSFMMYTFKVELCTRADKHPRGSCPYAHPGDVARRRPPRLYQALLCPEVRAKKVCPRLQECQCSHSAFEFWLHPDRYRTSMCEKGVRCSRPVCFFAHTPEELRPLPAGLKPAAAEDSSKRASSSSGGASTGPSRRTQYGQGPPGSAPHYLQQPVLLQQLGMQVPGALPMVPTAAAAGYAPTGYMGHAGLQPDMAPLHAYSPGGRLVPPEQLPGGIMLLPGSSQQYGAPAPGLQQVQHGQQAQPVTPLPSELLAAQFQQLEVTHSGHSPPAVRYFAPGMPGSGEHWAGASAGSTVVPGQRQQQPLLMFGPPDASSTDQRQFPVPYRHQQQQQQQSVMYLASPMEQQGAWPAASPAYQRRQQQQQQQPGYATSQAFDYTGGQPAFASSAGSSSTGSSSLGMLAPASVAGLAVPHPAMLPAAMPPAPQAQQVGPAIAADASGLSTSHVPAAGEGAATHVLASPADQNANW